MPQFLAFILLFALMLITSPGDINRSLLAQQRDAQGPRPFTEVDLTVKAVGLDTAYAKVRQRLGRPQRARKERILDDTCSPPHTDLTLYYPGLKIELQGTLARRNYEVVSMKVTSPQWRVAPGIRVGMEEGEVRVRLGTPVEELAEAGMRRIHYVTKGNLGGVALDFHAGRLVKIAWGHTLC